MRTMTRDGQPVAGTAVQVPMRFALPDRGPAGWRQKGKKAGIANAATTQVNRLSGRPTRTKSM